MASSGTLDGVASNNTRQNNDIETHSTRLGTYNASPGIYSLYKLNMEFYTVDLTHVGMCFTSAIIELNSRTQEGAYRQLPR